MTTASVPAETDCQRLVVEQALALAREVESTAGPAPHGRVLDRGEGLPHARGRDRLGPRPRRAGLLHPLRLRLGPPPARPRPSGPSAWPAGGARSPNAAMLPKELCGRRVGDGRVRRRNSGASAGRRAGRTAVGKRAACLANRSHRLDDRHRRAGGEPIGSGLVGGACEQVSGKRVKQTGTRWTVANANHIAERCGLTDSDPWTQYRLSA